MGLEDGSGAFEAMKILRRLLLHTLVSAILIHHAPFLTMSYGVALLKFQLYTAVPSLLIRR